MKALKVTISGSYRGEQDKIIDFANVTGVIPYQEEEIATQHIRKRYARMWIMGNDKFRERMKSVRECYIDDMQETDAEFSFVGKDIRAMTQEELQDLATAKDLKQIPLYKKTSEREMRMSAYATYSANVLKEDVNHKEVGFNLMKQPPIIVNDSAWRKDTTKKLTNDEVLSQEAIIKEKNSPLAVKVNSGMSRSDLESIAKSQGIEFHHKLSDANLYAKIYG